MFFNIIGIKGIFIVYVKGFFINYEVSYCLVNVLY